MVNLHRFKFDRRPLQVLLSVDWLDLSDADRKQALGQLAKEIDRLEGVANAPFDGDPEDRAKALSFCVPPGFALMRQAEVDRIHNESEALRIERDAARESCR